MASNVFNKIADIKNDVKRNSFDWSHDNNLTTDLGRITPVFCELVPPNSSIRIKPSFGLRFMPMMFPIQTKMKAYMSFYKVPLRTLWKDYMDFISADNTEEFQPPFINFQDADFEEGGCLSPSGLGDYFGIPTAITQGRASVVPPVITDPDAIGWVQGAVGAPTAGTGKIYAHSSTVDPAPGFGEDGLCTIPTTHVATNVTIAPKLAFEGVTPNAASLTLRMRIRLDLTTAIVSDFVSYVDTCHPNIYLCVQNNAFPASGSAATVSISQVIPATFNQAQYTDDPDGSTRTYHLYFDGVTMTTSKSIQDGSYSILPNLALTFPAISGMVNTDTTLWGTRSWTVEEVSVVTGSSTPYYSSKNNNGIKLSAYPFRAYEAVYNAYIRNTRNNPFILNGKKTYNKWITNDEGGADTTTPKSLFMANWASDAYTTALTSPQQGTAPLVGLTTYEETTYNAETGHSETTVRTALVDEDGNAYKLGFESNGEALKGVTYTPLKPGEMVNPQSLISPVTSGISINDFRNVNAYQRYLELNQFRGFSYKEIVEGRFDVNVRYDALNMPEYLGGITRDIVVNPITQTVETSSAGTYQGALGSQAGFATCLGDTNQSVSVFCDEESIILGIMYVVPMPVYDSLLPKWLTYRDRLDSFNPEFDHIGYQPIKVSELAAVQANTLGISQDTVFGYQRPWYEYVQKCDRAHGLFLTSLRNFIMYRSWSNVPELGKDFTTMKPGDVNNVFSVTEVSDKILGQIHFDCTAQLPISRVVVPRLE